MGKQDPGQGFGQTPNSGYRFEAEDEDILQTSIYGGLNTISNRLSIPLEDSPDLLNVRITTQGDVAKREGTHILTSVGSLTDVSGTTLMPVTFQNGKTGVFAKEQQDIKLYLLENNLLVSAMTKSTVFSPEARGVRADYVMTSETEPRIIMTTGVNVPIQLVLVEASGVGGSGSWVFTDTRFAQISTSNAVVWKNGTRLTGFTTGYSSGTVTITHASIATNDVMEILFVTWQWWAEAIKVEGDQVYNKTNKFHVSKDDQSVAIPSRLTMDIAPYTFGLYPLRAYRTSNTNNYILATNRKPPDHVDYAFSLGGRYDPADGDEVVPGITHLTFGKIRPYSGGVPADSEPVHFVRGYKLTFRGGDGQSGSKLIVKADDTAYTQNTTLVQSGSYTSSPTYWLRDSGYSILNGGSASTTVAKYITLDSTTTIGVPSTAFIEFINAEEDSKSVGTSALSEYTAFKDGCLIPAYGLGNVADYSRYSFPRTVTVFQGRLVFGGFPTDPMTLLMSNTFDSTRPGYFFNNFQTTLERGISTDAVDVLLTNTLDDLITAVIEFQNSLFVFTRKALYRIHGGQAASVTPSNTFLAYVAGLGAVNAQSVVKVDKTVLFLSSSGVYDIMPTTENVDFTAGERSLKIRNLLQSSETPYNEATSWMVYDQVHEEVYLAVSGNLQAYVADKLFVYSLIRDAWCEYSLVSRLWHSMGGCVITTTANNTQVVLAHARYTNFASAPDNIEYQALRSSKYTSRYADQLNTFTVSGTGAFTISTNIPVRRLTYTTSAWRLEYETHIPTINNGFGFQLSNVTSIQDCRVYLNGVELSFGTQWVKTHKSSVYLLVAPGDGKTLVIEYVDQDLKYPIVAYRDNVRLVQGTDYTITFDAPNTCYKLNFTSGINNSVILYGSMYSAYHKTPLFFRGSLHKLKNMVHYIGYFDNAVGQDVYRKGDENALSGQSYEEIIGRYKTLLNFNLVFLYEEMDEGFTSEDVYGFTEIYWDTSVFDITPSYRQFKRFSRLVEPIIGNSYGFQVLTWVFSDTAFDLVGYQIITAGASRSSIGQFD